MTDASRHVRRRRRAIERLRALTTGAAVAGVAGTAGFGVLAAASWSGDPTASTTADLPAGNGSPNSAPGDIFGSTPNRGSTFGSGSGSSTQGTRVQPVQPGSRRSHATTGGSR